MSVDYSGFGLTGQDRHRHGRVAGNRPRDRARPRPGRRPPRARQDPAGRHDEIKQVGPRSKRSGRRAIVVPTDVSKVDQVRAMIDHGEGDVRPRRHPRQQRRLDRHTPALDVTEEEYDQTMAASLKSVFFACQAAARVMIPQGGGKIINIGSNFGVVAFQGRSVYAAAKAGVHHLSRALSLEWAKQA